MALDDAATIGGRLTTIKSISENFKNLMNLNKYFLISAHLWRILIEYII